MEATPALAPALGVRGAATRVQAAWRGRRARRAYLQRMACLWLGPNYGKILDELGPTPRAFVQLAMRGWRVMAVDTDTVLGVGAAGHAVVVGGWQGVD